MYSHFPGSLNVMDLRSLHSVARVGFEVEISWASSTSALSVSGCKEAHCRISRSVLRALRLVC